jgi:hypothetical protein
MRTVVKVQGTDVLRGVLDQWKAASTHTNRRRWPQCSPRTRFSRGSAHTAWVALVLLPAAPALQDDLAGGGSAGDSWLGNHALPSGSLTSVRTIARIVVICVSFPADRSESLFEQVLEFLLLGSAEALQALAERVR